MGILTILFKQLKSLFYNALSDKILKRGSFLNFHAKFALYLRANMLYRTRQIA